MDSTFDLEWCHSNLLKAVEPLSISHRHFELCLSFIKLMMDRIQFLIKTMSFHFELLKYLLSHHQL